MLNSPVSPVHVPRRQAHLISQQQNVSLRILRQDSLDGRLGRRPCSHDYVLVVASPLTRRVLPSKLQFYRVSFSSGQAGKAGGWVNG